MIDIHTHLLNNVDDGSRNVTESLTYIKMAAEAGFTDIILTPHYIEGSYENNYKLIEPKIQELKAKIEDNNITINVYHGNEVYISENIGELIKSGKAATLAGSKYFLFELLMNNRLLTLNKLIMQIKEAGVIPVLAHPERYSFVQKNPDVLRELISEGVLMQSNYGSIIGQYGKGAQKTIITMLESNMIHFLGTDTHRDGHIYAHFYNVRKEFLKYISREKFEELTTKNAECILKDCLFEAEKPSEIKNKRFFFR